MRWVRLAVAGILIAYASGVVRMPQPQEPVVQPLTEMQMSAKTLRDIMSTVPMTDRLWVKTIYTSAAKVTRADGEEESPEIQTTESLRDVHIAILKFVWKHLAGNEPGKYAGLADAVSTVITHAVGTDNRPLTPELREKAAEAFDAIAWAGLGEG